MNRIARLGEIFKEGGLFGLSVSFAAVVSFAEHDAVGNVGDAALAPSGGVVSVLCVKFVIFAAFALPKFAFAIMFRKYQKIIMNTNWYL